MTVARAVAAVLLVLTGTSAVAQAIPAAAARVRVQHHLRVVERLGEHFASVLKDECPRFSSAAAGDAYVDAETDDLVLLVAHLEQAWIEAKRTDDDDVRREAKAPRRRSAQARALVDKLSQCAERNGATFSAVDVWRRVERDVPRRQAEIALPQ